MEIATRQGRLRGEQGKGVVRFRGVPYATAERFALPGSAPSWSGTRDATAHGVVGPQPPSRLRAVMGEFDRPQGEDCLTLTIATPEVTGRRKVILFLHGGAYWTGAGSLDWYDGGVLAPEGAVVVGVNYRLGAFGFLAHPAVSPGNLGLADMMAALRWVRDNIADFGGDPANVTVIGQSAGAQSVMWMLAHPEGEGLFHRAVLMSCWAAMVPQTVERAAEYAEFIADSLGTTAAGLREVPAPRLLQASVQLARSIAGFADITPPFLPVSDALADTGAFISAAARGAVARGVKLVVGTTREELHGFFAADPAMANPDPRRTEAKFAELAGDPGSIELYRRRRLGGSVMDLLGDLVTDHLFLLPSLAFAEAVPGSFVYQFDWAAPGNRFKACHCIDLPFLFGNLEAWHAPMLEGGHPGEIAALSMIFRTCLGNFTETGDPSAVGLPWPEYRPGSRRTMVFGPITGPVGDPAGAGWRAGFDG